MSICILGLQGLQAFCDCIQGLQHMISSTIRQGKQGLPVSSLVK